MSGELKTQLTQIVGNILPGQVGGDTVEGRLLAACVDGMLNGRATIDVSGAGTKLTNPGAIDMVAREAEKIVEYELEMEDELNTAIDRAIDRAVDQEMEDAMDLENAATHVD
jgi:hypothetical protein